MTCTQQGSSGEAVHAVTLSRCLLQPVLPAVGRQIRKDVALRQLPHEGDDPGRSHPRGHADGVRQAHEPCAWRLRGVAAHQVQEGCRRQYVSVSGCSCSPWLWAHAVCLLWHVGGPRGGLWLAGGSNHCCASACEREAIAPLSQLFVIPPRARASALTLTSNTATTTRFLVAVSTSAVFCVDRRCSGGEGGEAYAWLGPAARRERRVVTSARPCTGCGTHCHQGRCLQLCICRVDELPRRRHGSGVTHSTRRWLHCLQEKKIGAGPSGPGIGRAAGRGMLQCHNNAQHYLSLVVAVTQSP